jgi:hypothetical protein
MDAIMFGKPAGPNPRATTARATLAVFGPLIKSVSAFPRVRSKAETGIPPN